MKAKEFLDKIWIDDTQFTEVWLYDYTKHKMITLNSADIILCTYKDVDDKEVSKIRFEKDHIFVAIS